MFSAPMSSGNFARVQAALALGNTRTEAPEARYQSFELPGLPAAYQPSILVASELERAGLITGACERKNMWYVRTTG
jgi:hypothetical protein